MEVPGGYDNKLLVCVNELLGTAMLLIAVNWSGGNVVGVCLTLYANIIIFGSVSGGHFNPAVTAGVLIRQSYEAPSKIAVNVAYAALIVAFQLAGATLGCLVSYAGLGVHTVTKFSESTGALMAYNVEVPTIAQLCSATLVGFADQDRTTAIPCDATGYYGQIFLAEVVGTFVFVGVILDIKYNHTAKDDLVNGVGVALCLAAMIKTLGPISGACLNPAVGIVQTLFQWGVFGGLEEISTYSTSGLAYYMLGPLFGGIFAGVFSLFRKYALDSQAEAVKLGSMDAQKVADDDE